MVCVQFVDHDIVGAFLFSSALRQSGSIRLRLLTRVHRHALTPRRLHRSAGAVVSHAHVYSHSLKKRPGMAMCHGLALALRHMRSAQLGLATALPGDILPRCCHPASYSGTPARNGFHGRAFPCSTWQPLRGHTRIEDNHRHACLCVRLVSTMITKPVPSHYTSATEITHAR